MSRMRADRDTPPDIRAARALARGARNLLQRGVLDPSDALRGLITGLECALGKGDLSAARNMAGELAQWVAENAHAGGPQPPPLPPAARARRAG